MIFIFNAALAEDTDHEVVVTGTRTARELGEAPVAVEVISRQEILESGSRDLADLLEQQRGIDVQRSMLGTGLRLRGLDPIHTLILVDGQRVVGRKDGTYDLSRIPVDSIERIEIVKGASSALYGSDALGGVINLVTRRASEPWQADLSARGGSPSIGDASLGLGLRGERLGLRLDGGWHGAAPYDADPSDPATTLNGTQQVDGSLTGDLRLSPALTLKGRGSWSGTDARGIDLGNGGAVLDRRNLTEDALGRFDLDWLPDASSRWTSSIATSVFRDQYASDQRQAGELDLYQETQETLHQLESQLDRVMGRHLATLGVEGDLGQLRSDRLDGGEGQRWTAAIYLQDELRLADRPRLVVVPGLRGDLDSWFGGALAPSLGLRLDPVPQLALRASAGSGWRAPSFRELLLSFDNASVGYRVEGNPDLRPERSLSLSVGAEWTPSEALSLSLQAHRDRLHDLIQTGTLEETPALVRYGYLNVAEARSQGVELGASWDPTRSVGLDASFTFLDAWDLTADRPLEGRAPLRGTLSTRLAAGREGPLLVARASLVGPRPFYLGEEPVHAPPHALLDLRVEQGLSDGLSLSVGADNVLDAGDPRFLPVAPRLFYAGLDVSLQKRGAR